MGYQMKWDQSLVKKFSSTNHYKILNQLRTEISSYPIKRQTHSKTKNNVNNVLENRSSKRQLDLDLSRSSNYTDISRRQTTVSSQNNDKEPTRFNNHNNNNTNLNSPDTEIFNNTSKVMHHRNNDIKQDNTIIHNDSIANNEDSNPILPLPIEVDIHQKTSNIGVSENNDKTFEQTKELPISFKERLSQIDMR